MYVQVMFVADNGSLVVRLSLVDQGGLHLSGTYRCHVTNGYSTDQAAARLYLFGAERTYHQIRPERVEVYLFCLDQTSVISL